MTDRGTKERWVIQIVGFLVVLAVTFIMALWGDPVALEVWDWAL